MNGYICTPTITSAAAAAGSAAFLYILKEFFFLLEGIPGQIYTFAKTRARSY